MCKARKSSRSAATTVEFALVAPIFFMCLLLVFEFGWLLLIRHTADNAAYEAARVGIVPGATAQDARNEANRLMQLVGTRSFNVTVTPATIDFNTDEIDVTVEVPCSSNGIIASRFLRDVVFESNCRLLSERPRL